MCSDEVGGCTYFKFDYASSECTLLRFELHNGYMRSCDIIAGPEAPSYTNCETSDSCEWFFQESCAYSGEVVYSSLDVVYASQCQALLADIGEDFGAELFVHTESHFNRCELREDTHKKMCFSGRTTKVLSSLH